MGAVRSLCRRQLRVSGCGTRSAAGTHCRVGTLGLRRLETGSDLAARSAGVHRSCACRGTWRGGSHRSRSRCILRACSRSVSPASRGRTATLAHHRRQLAARRSVAVGDERDRTSVQGARMNVPPWHAEHWARLQSRRQRDALPHALLLCGPRGLGKRDFLRRFVGGLLCQNPADGDACGTCRSCLLVNAGTHPDVVSLSYGLRKDGVQRSEIVVDQIRELSARLSTSSQFGGWQIASIDPADAMNTAAANALLKTLEEPASQTMLVLLADESWRMPA